MQIWQETKIGPENFADWFEYRCLHYFVPCRRYIHFLEAKHSPIFVYVPFFWTCLGILFSHIAQLYASLSENDDILTII